MSWTSCLKNSIPYREPDLSGIRLIVSFHSFLPPKLLKIVNFLGFKGVRDVAFTELNAVAYELPGIYSVIGELVLIMYWLYIEVC